MLENINDARSHERKKRQSYWFPNRDRKFSDKSWEYRHITRFRVLLLYHHHRTNVEAVGFFERSVISYKSTWRHTRAENIIKNYENFFHTLNHTEDKNYPVLYPVHRRDDFSGTKSSCRMYSNKTHISLYILYRVSREECARLRENVS